MRNSKLLIMAQQQMKKLKDSSRDWKAGQKCEIYDHKTKQWVEGEVVEVFKDEEGEWVDVKYGRTRKQLPPDSEELRDLNKNNESQLLAAWEVGAQCELFSRLDGKWIEGEIIHIFSDSVGEWIRVQSGQHVREVFQNEVEHDVRPRGTCDVRVSIDDIKKIKNMTAKFPPMALVLNRIFAKSYQFAKDDTTKTYTYPCINDRIRTIF